MRKVNYRSDFDFVLRLFDCRGVEVGFPEYDWVARFWTGVKANAYEVSFVGGVCRGCYNDDGRIHVVVDNHHLSPGVLKVEFVAMLPDGIYPDGDERVAVPAALDVELVREAAPCPSSFEVEVMLPYIKFRYEDLTDEERAELMRPAVEAAERAEAAESERAKQEEARKGAEKLRVSAEASRVEAEEARKAAEQGRVAAEKGRVTAEEARVAAERERAEVFDGFRGELDGKADKPAVFEVVATSVTDGGYNCTVVPDASNIQTGDILSISFPDRSGMEVVVQARYYNRGIGRFGCVATTPDEPVFVLLQTAYASGFLSEQRVAKVEELSNIVGNDTEGSIEAIEPGIVTEALRKVPQTLTPEEQAVVKGNIGVSKMELFCDLFSNAAGSHGYARMTDGEFDCELNGLRLTYEEAVAVINSHHKSVSQGEAISHFTVRTNIPVATQWGCDLTRYAQANLTVEVLNLPMVFAGSALMQAFYGCSRLRKVYGLSHLNGVIDSNAFANCRALEHVGITKLKSNLNLQWSPLLTLASLEYLVTNAANTSAITVTVHADVYAKLTDESNTEWHRVLTDASAKNISFATV